MNIAFIPIDDRPVCYLLPKQIAEINPAINLHLPERELLGNLEKQSQTDKILQWLENLSNIDTIILSLDTIAYGGLIPSRRCDDDFETIKNKIDKLKTILKKHNAKIFAFSSIMRISNNNINEEEKEYWSEWGKKIFDYSYYSHKQNQQSCIATHIPDEILADYLKTRQRNFEINKIYLDWQKEGIFNTLIFSKDDCSEYGFNVQEAQTLEKLGGFTKTGADEIPISLLARSIEKKIKIAPIFLAPEHKNLISHYEDISIEQSTLAQLKLANCQVKSPDEADILLFINNFEHNQGEHVMNIATKEYDGKWLMPQKPYMIADLRYANGGDNSFVTQILNTDFDENFYGYSGWNTSANSLGSLICTAKMKFSADKYNKNAFINSQITRLLDDWAYQANVRSQMNSLDIKELKNKIIKHEEKLFDFFKTKKETKYKYCWNRKFEIEVELI
ncbi:MAG: DUF4127 family protein [Candidatus Gastranaerophilales bacterium]